MDANKIIYKPAVTDHWKMLHPKKHMVLGTQNLNPGEELVLKIDRLEKDQIIKGSNGREDAVTFLWFEKCNVPMCLNIGNSRIIASLYGDFVNKWIGKAVQIYSGEVKAVGGGKTQGLCIRQVIPSMGESISEYEDAIDDATSLDDLKDVFLSIPKHLQPRLNKLTNKRKKELS